MSGSPKRGEPRHVDVDRLRISLPTRTVVLLALVLAVVLAVGGIAVVSAGLVPGGDDQIRTLRAGADPTSDAPQDRPSSATVQPTAAPDEFRIVQATRIRPIEQGVGKPEQLLRERAESAVTPPTEFRVASFNVLGASHTGQGGRHSKFTDAATRMRWTVAVLGSLGISVAGFQEFQPPQHVVFRREAPGWSVWPTAAQGRQTMVNAVVWRSDEWQAVRTLTIQIPYFGGRPRAMPYVLLQHLQTGQRVWFTSFHNPADAHGPAQHWRNEALRRQIGLARTLMADGTPVVFTGDMNDREEYFCPLTTSVPMHAANGGSTGTPCAPPPQMNVDWIFGSTDIEFSGFVANDSGLVGRTSDHPLVYVNARVTPG